MRIFLSDHAEQRMQQRGAKPDHVAIVATLYDQKVHLQDGITALSCSKRVVAKVRELLGDSVASRVSKLTLLTNFDEGVIVTVIKGGRYRPGQGKRKRHVESNCGRGHQRFVRRCETYSWC